MNPIESAWSQELTGAHAILLVDDEPRACKWFAHLYGDEFVVRTAGSADAALALLAQRGHQVAVLLSDYRMPGRDGVSLLAQARQTHPQIARLLVSAYADKQVAMDAVNQGHVEKILEKPLDEALTRQTLREALVAGRRRAHDLTLIEQRAASLRETLGFLAHEVATPLATVSGYLCSLREGQRDAPAAATGLAGAAQHNPGAALFMLEAAQRRTDYVQSLLSTFVQTARDAYRDSESVHLRAGDLVRAVQSEYPFEAGEAAWMQSDLAADFALPGRRDLLYLVLSTLIKNALLALRSAAPAAPILHIALARATPAPGLPPQAVVRVHDNGPGIAPEVLARLTHEPVTRSSHSGGSGMGLLFCQRVMISLGGTIELRSEPGQGTTVTLFFPSAEERKSEESA